MTSSDPRKPGITYTSTLSKLTPGQLEGFFEGWPTHPDPHKHLAILQGSAAVWLAMDGDQCVGFINAISDGNFYAFIPLLEVLPTHKGRGIGTELGQRMAQTFDHFYALDLLCDEALVPFYQKLGFSPSVGMVKRNYVHQKGNATSTSPIPR